MALADLERDEHGYLKDLNAWNEDIAHEIAAEEDVRLTEDSFKVIHFLRGTSQLKDLRSQSDDDDDKHEEAVTSAVSQVRAEFEKKMAEERENFEQEVQREKRLHAAEIAKLHDVIDQLKRKQRLRS